MDIGKGIGDFFRGVFGGNKEDEEKKRRQQQEAARKAAASKPAPIKVVSAPKPTQQIQVAQPNKPTPTLTIAPPPKIQSLNEFMQKPQTAKPEPKKPDNNFFALLGEGAKQAVGGAISVGQGLARIPETIGRSINEALPENMRDKSAFAKDASTNKSPVRKFLYGDEEIKTYQAQGKELNKGVKDFSGGKVDVPAPLIALGLFGLDAGGGGLKKAAEKGSKEAVREIEELAAGAAAKRPTEQAAKDAVRIKAEKDLGRELTEDEAKDLTTRTETIIKREKEAATKVEQPQTATPAKQPTREDVGKSYADTYNTINKDTNLTPEQKVNFLAEAKTRHTNMLREIDEAELQQNRQVEETLRARAAEREAEQARVAEAQAQQEAAVTPPAGSSVTPQAEVVDDVSTNRAAYSDDAQYRQAQDDRLKERSQNPVMRFFNKAQQEVADPRAVQQRLDNQEFRRLKREGLLPKGQRELADNQSLAVLRGKIENPGKPAELNDRAKYGNYSVNDIIKFYGKEDGDKARAFENYRIYKDELERMKNGKDNTIGVDPAAMVQYVRQYEGANPLAIEHNASLRAHSLDLLRRMNEARIDAPDLYPNSAKLEFYTPRTDLLPEDLLRPQMSGGIRSGAKQTQSRIDRENGIVRSPLSIYKEQSVATERALAQQDADLLMRDMARRGVPGFNEVVDADVVIQHKAAIQNMRDLGDALQQAKQLRDSLSREKKLTTKQLNKAEKQIAQAEDKAVSLMDDLLKKASGDGNQALNDLTGRGSVEYKAALQEIKDQKYPNLTAAEAKAQRNYDIKELNKVWDESAVRTRQQKLDVANSLGNNEDANAIRATIPGLENEVDAVRQMFNQSREEISDIKGAKSEAYGEMRDTTQNLERGVQSITYKVDGETGKVEIPADLADELDKANRDFNLSPLEQAAGAVGNVVKLTWTGALSPVFKTYNVLVKNPLLQYRNADGLSGVSPAALSGGLRSVFATPGMRAFKEDMLRNGAAYENALQTRNVYTNTADDIAARANIVAFFNRNPVSTLQDLWKGLNQGLAYFDNAQRDAVAYGAYSRAKRLGATEEQAKQIAAQAPAKVFGDFERVSRLARNAEVILPYSGAIQAGARAMARATKTKPIETTLKDATFLAAAAGFTAYSLQNNEQYYKDMVESGKEYELDNNWTVVLPGATRDENGNWSGVVKIPLTPDLRPFNRATWRSVLAATAGEGLDVGLVASELFNQFTGDLSTSIYDDTRTDKGENPWNGFMSGGALITQGKIATGVDPRTGQPLADENISRLNRTEQATDYTSPGARNISEALGGLFTPLQVDASLAQMGGFGDLVQAKPDEETGQPNPLKDFFNFAKPLNPGKGQSDKQKTNMPYFEDIDAVSKTIDPKDEVTFRAFQALHSKKTEAQKNNLLNTPTKAQQFMQYQGDGSFMTTPLFEAERKLDALQRARGKVGNPLFDLAPQELQKVLTYKSSKIAREAGQDYTKNGEGLFMSLGLDEPWYQKFTDAESAYNKSIFGDSDGSKQRTFSGKEKPALTDEQRALQNKYFSYPSGSAERKAFLAANQWMKDYWAETNEFTDEERKALGFNSLDGDNVFDGNTGDKFGGRGGRRGGGEYIPLPELLNETGNLKRLESLTKGDKQVALSLQKLFAPQRGGRAQVTLGASSRGQG